MRIRNLARWRSAVTPTGRSRFLSSTKLSREKVLRKKVWIYEFCVFLSGVKQHCVFQFNFCLNIVWQAENGKNGDKLTPRYHPRLVRFLEESSLHLPEQITNIQPSCINLTDQNEYSTFLSIVTCVISILAVAHCHTLPWLWCLDVDAFDCKYFGGDKLQKSK